ncbi:MAG: peptidylprolyl isomerase [Myxococcales bacterium]|jgi:peptidyl-prolyl cis-trans isomerase A (cyclophilin A)|nr:peptidylprolyl isomerase [Myxococcales bacterium]
MQHTRQRFSLCWLLATTALVLCACRPAEPAPDASATKPEAKAAVLPDICPETFTAVLHTTRGDIRIAVTRADAPLGAQRFYELVKNGYYTDVAFFRVIAGFMAQAGIHGDPAMNAKWRGARIPDDPVKARNVRGAVSFAMGGPNTRTTQFFINFKDNLQLDGMGFAPFGKVEDMQVVDQLFSGYGEGAPSGAGPAQMLLQQQGNAYLKAQFPKLDYILSAEIAL